MPKSPLEMKCPHCRKYAGHRVIKTDPAHYRCGDEETLLFERIAGIDISFRQRTRHCDYCGKDFVTDEMNAIYRSAMINEIKRLEQKVEISEDEIKRLKKLWPFIKQYKQKINELEHQVQVLNTKLVSIAEIATPNNY